MQQGIVPIQYQKAKNDCSSKQYRYSYFNLVASTR